MILIVMENHIVLAGSDILCYIDWQTSCFFKLYFICRKRAAGAVGAEESSDDEVESVRYKIFLLLIWSFSEREDPIGLIVCEF